VNVNVPRTGASGNFEDGTAATYPVGPPFPPAEIAERPDQMLGEFSGVGIVRDTKSKESEPVMLVGFSRAAKFLEAASDAAGADIGTDITEPILAKFGDRYGVTTFRAINVGIWMRG